MRRLALLALLLPLCAAAWPATGAAGDYRDLGHDGAARRYYVHVPADLPPGPAPLVLVLHGAGGSGDQAVQRYGWEDEADREGFVAAGPEALPVKSRWRASFLFNPRVWNDGSGRGSEETLAHDDLGYIAAVIDDIARRDGIDRDRVFVTGFSNGASMTHRLGAEKPSLAAAIAPYSGPFWPTPAHQARALPVLFLIGDTDPLNPLAGGEVEMPWGNTSTKAPVRESVSRWVERLDCAGEGAALPGPVPAVRLEIWSRCRDGGALTWAVIAGIGHHWAGAGDSGLPERWVGPYVDTGFDATDFIWNFFARAR
jgi:polyhydroxybutyrate depolymerase